MHAIQHNKFMVVDGIHFQNGSLKCARRSRLRDGSSRRLNVRFLGFQTIDRKRESNFIPQCKIVGGSSSSFLGSRCINRP